MSHENKQGGWQATGRRTLLVLTTLSSKHDVKECRFSIYTRNLNDNS